MRLKLFIVLLFAAAAPLSGAQHETLVSLKVGSVVYQKVTVTGVTATHVYFTHEKGMGSARLADLDPTLQQRFHFDPQAAAARQAELARGNALYQKAASETPAPKRPLEAVAAGEQGKPNDGSAPNPIHAKSFLNQQAPAMAYEKWVTAAPETQGKFVLLDFWATWCGPCRRSIPRLNELQAKNPEKMVVIGLSNEPEEAIRKMTDPKIEYAVASDTQSRTLKEVEVKGIPHAMLIDPKGVVRFEGNPGYLTDEKLQVLLAKYGQAH